MKKKFYKINIAGPVTMATPAVTWFCLFFTTSIYIFSLQMYQNNSQSSLTPSTTWDPAAIAIRYARHTTARMRLHVSTNGIRGHASAFWVSAATDARKTSTIVPDINVRMRLRAWMGSMSTLVIVYLDILDWGEYRGHSVHCGVNEYRGHFKCILKVGKCT